LKLACEKKIREKITINYLYSQVVDNM